jgi:hypothetical protein
LRLDIDFIPPVEHVVHTISGIATRSQHLEPAFEAAFARQEQAQREPFAGGALVRSGELRDSLTQPNAFGAIREAHAAQAEFGTSVPYARPAGHRAGTHVLVGPVPELDSLMLTYIVQGGAL